MIVIPASDPRAIVPLSNAERRRLWRWKYDTLPIEQQIGAEDENEEKNSEH